MRRGVAAAASYTPETERGPSSDLAPDSPFFLFLPRRRPMRRSWRHQVRIVCSHCACLSCISLELHGCVGPGALRWPSSFTWCPSLVSILCKYRMFYALVRRACEHAALPASGPALLSLSRPTPHPRPTATFPGVAHCAGHTALTSPSRLPILPTSPRGSPSLLKGTSSRTSRLARPSIFRACAFSSFVGALSAHIFQDIELWTSRFLA